MKFVIARPNIKAQHTAEEFNQAGLSAIALPVMDISLNNARKLVTQFQQSNPCIVIVTSTYAAEWLIQYADALSNSIQNASFICVGKKTAEKLSTIIEAANIQTAAPENSEGVLNSPSIKLALNTHKAINIMLLKGDGGRELIASTLQQKHIVLNVLNVYKREKNLRGLRAFVFEPNEITCIIATSCEIIDILCATLDQSCLQNLHWIVASERIKDYAYNKGVRQLTVSDGANNRALLDCAKSIN